MPSQGACPGTAVLDPEAVHSPSGQMMFTGLNFTSQKATGLADEYRTSRVGMYAVLFCLYSWVTLAVAAEEDSCGGLKENAR